ncbi:adenine nucleotide alpha hydrolases-like protein [Aspergillus heteromorphus CBS 117.55]|uniref:Adenine nucleotide alpha hydrolases-like protein n=1 Tax=Aspergillus heteromorphus CBS 117.55 TaxID=1448321 RepID=A0A317V6U2_9EURO|nr:adenine nucleotide alpha hydrolases-like protein [Aspergillus heteromorphus CBS 117.55]PWY68677.1 adenine nucleotide alpha hydrolases-like protein [Aspergillus heteromorphus CBS 117.55]
MSASTKSSLDGDKPIHRSTTTTPTGKPRSRRKSIQFNIGAPDPQLQQLQLPSRSASAAGRRRSPSHVSFTHEKDPKAPVSRGPSPPPPQTYERGVSFDTFDNPDAADFSLTLNYKHKGYQSTRRSRTFLCGTDQNDYSDFALEWLIDELVDDGDEIVCLRAVEKDSSIASDAAVEAGKYRKEAEKLFEQVIQKNSQNEKAISLVLELAVGKIQDIIQRMIRIYEPAVLIVGTRGRNLGGVQGLLPGSVSKYCLQQSPIPVIVVRPTTKREKRKKKRLADPTRRNYNHILEMSERRGNNIFDRSSSRDSSVSKLPDEEAAVAAALGLPQSYQNSRSSLSTSERSSVSHDESPSPTSSPDAVSRSPLVGSVENSEIDTGSDDEPTVMHVEDHKDSPSPPTEPSNGPSVETLPTDNLSESTETPPSSGVPIPLIVTEESSPTGSEK